jgi:uncharacterized protein
MLDYKKFNAYVVTNPFRVILISLLIAFAAMAGLKDTRFTNDYRYFFTADNPYLQAFESLEKTYSSPDNILYVIQPTEGPALSPEGLSLIGSLTEKSWQIPFSTRVDSVTNFQNTRAIDDDLEVRDLVPDPENVTEDLSQYVERVVMEEPLLANRLLSADGRTTAVVVTLKPPKDDALATAEIVSKAREIKADIEARYPDYRVELTGSQMLSNSFSESAFNDITTLTPLMFVIIAVVLMLLTRQFWATLISVIVIVLSAMIALGAAGWLNIPLSPPSSGAPTIILTVAVADCVHILISALVAMGNGKDKKTAIIESANLNFQAVFLTSITTAIGLLSLNFSDAPPYRDLGTIAGIGSIAAWFLAITLFPAFLSIIPLKANKTLSNQSAFMGKLADFVIQKRRVLMVSSLLLVVACTAMLPRLYFNDRFVEYFDESMDFRTASDWSAENLTSIYILNFSIPAGEQGDISNPDYLKHLDKFAKWMRTQPEVKHVATFSDIIKRINRSMNGDEQDYYVIPDDRDLAAQYLLLYEMSLPYGLDLNDQINIDKSATRVIVTLTDIGTKDMKNLRQRTLDWMAENGPQERVVEPAGQSVMFSYIGERNFIAMAEGTVYAFLLISFCLFIALRSIRLGLVSLIPNIAPTAVAMGIFSLFQTEIGLWTSFITATAIGLIVDATVHILSKYRVARLELGYGPEDAIRYSFKTVGIALGVSSLILICGFLVLAQSPFLINGMIGVMVSLTILIALIIDLLFLPTLLLAIDKDVDQQSNLQTT